MQEVLPGKTPPDLKTFFLGGIFLLLLLTLIHVASVIVIPIILAFVLKLVFQPVFRLLRSWKFPRIIAATIVLCALVIGIVGLGTVLSAPATSWAQKLPESFPQLQERFEFLSKPMEKTQKILIQADNLGNAPGQKVMAVQLPGTRLSDRIFADTQLLASGLFTTMLVLFFLLTSDDIFLRRLVEVLPTFQNKRQAVDISQQIEHDISRYLLTITTMNAGVGIATGIIFRICHIDNPLLWGSLAFLLNYIPMMGSLLAAAVFLLVGLMTVNTLSAAMLPALLYMLVHIVESIMITPLLMARRFTLNPVLVILALVFWYWMWGLAGAVLAMPMLAITKIICDRVEALQAFGHFLEGDSQDS
jgi:predicted PurR-regulated permease PerM